MSNILRLHEVAPFFQGLGDDFSFSVDYNLLALGWQVTPAQAQDSWILYAETGIPLRREGTLELVHMALALNQVTVPDIKSAPFSELHKHQGILSFIVMNRQLTDAAVENSYSWSIR
jgi:hypothetical protein